MSVDAARTAFFIALLVFGSIVILSRLRPPAVPPLGAIGYRVRGRLWLVDLVVGMAAGAGMATATIFALQAMGAARVQPSLLEGFQLDLDTLRALAIGLLGTLATAAYQELINRGVLRIVLSSRWNLVVAGLASAGLWALFFVAAPDASVLSSLTIVVVGLALVYATYITRLLWLPFGLHFGWIATAGVVFGTPLAGEIGDALYRTALVGEPWLSGGSFGLWGGVAGLLAWLIVIGLLWVWSHISDRVVPFDELPNRSIL